MKRETILIAVLFLSICLQAQSISQEKARDIAAQFVAQKMPSKSKGAGGKAQMLREIHQHDVLSETDGTQLYMYDIGSNEGYVVVSASEQTPEVLAYSDRGSISATHLPDAMRTLLMAYAAEIRATQSSPSSAKTAAAAPKPTTPVEPLVGCQWNQLAPYNNLCPIYGSGRSATGCVATAMAQVLYCVQPQSCAALDAYTTKTNRLSISAMGETTFDWQQMERTYAANATGQSADAVARLMLCCGQSTEMDYGQASATPAENVVYAFRNSFGLASSCHQVWRKDCSAGEWSDMFYDEISHGRPVLVCGNNAQEGHAFVCDGCDSDGYFHINWGWNGGSDGYFLIECLSPSNAKERAANDGYNNEMTAIVGIRRTTTGEESSAALKLTNVVSMPGGITRFGAEHDFSITMNLKVANMNKKLTAMELSLALVDDDNTVLQVANEVTNLSIGYGQEKNISVSGYLGHGLNNRTVRLVPVSRQAGNTAWTLCENTIAHGILLNISDKDAVTTREMRGQYEPLFALSNLRFTGNGTTGYEQKMQLDVTNEGLATCGTVWVLVDNVMRKTLALNLDPGQTETVQAYFTLTAGSHKVDICSRTYNTSTSKYEYTPLLSRSISIMDKSICDLSAMKLTLTTEHSMSGTTYVFNEPTVAFTCECQNNGSETYNDEVAVILTDAHGLVVDSYETYVHIGAGETVVVSGTVGNMTPMTTYKLEPAFKKQYGQYVIWNRIGSMNIRYDTTTAIKSVSADDANAVTFTLDGRRVSGSTLPHGLYIVGGRKRVR